MDMRDYSPTALVAALLCVVAQALVVVGLIDSGELAAREIAAGGVFAVTALVFALLSTRDGA